MSFKLGTKSKEKLEGVNEDMVQIVSTAISLSKQDFSVICGMRTKQEQEALVAKGASQTMKSKHLEGMAVDLMAWVAGSGGRWELNLYDEIADGMAQAASELGIRNLKWGAAWHIDDLASWWENGKSAEEAMNSYVDLRRSQGRRPFIDAPHFQLG
jgi:peptidoglycan L-alanyl-D-glutamate endopeptidase CwlK